MRLLIAVFLLFIGCSSAAAAEIIKLGCREGAQATDCFLAQAKFSFTQCRTKYSQAMRLAAISGRPNPQADDELAACIDSYKEQISPFYGAARSALAGKKDAEAALKEMYAYWLSSMASLPAQSGETERERERRLTERTAGIQDRASRVEVER